MRPLTDHVPKPMVPVNGRTLIDRVLDRLSSITVEQVIVNTHYKADILEQHLMKRQCQLTPPAIVISREEALLETGGGIANALPLLRGESFYVVNSDIFWIDGARPALLRLAETWDESKMDALLLIHPVERAIGYDGNGDFCLRDTGQLKRTTASSHPYVFTGVQILSSRLFNACPEGPFSMNVLYGKQALPDGTLPRIHGLVHDGEWLHIGTPEGVALAETFLEGRE